MKTIASVLFIVIGSISILAGVRTENVQAHKIILKQNGYTQFIQFNVTKPPPMSEFTLCTWIRINDLEHVQTIFLYQVKSNRAIRLWLDSGGRNLIVSIGGETWSNPVDIDFGVWRHLCLSYQSDFGALALYMSKRLSGCTSKKNLVGYVVPGGGHFILGYGSKKDGLPHGLEGEIFGFNFILKSTIERNHTIPSIPNLPFVVDKIKDKQINTDFVEFSDLQTSEFQSKNIELPHFAKKNRSFIQIKRPNSFLQHEVGRETTTHFQKPTEIMNNENIMENSEIPNKTRSKPEIYKMWSDAHRNFEMSKLNPQRFPNNELSGSDTDDLPFISEYEVPPPLGPAEDYILMESLKMQKPPVEDNTFVLSHTDTEDSYNNMNDSTDNLISEVEVPPPLEKNQKVYGQWTSSMFAGSVLNYLKSINFNNREQKWVPHTIPLKKVSDDYPYTSDSKMSKVKSQYEFRRNKRDTRTPQINVKILEEDLRSVILRQHAQNHPEHVEITNRGETYKVMDHRFYRNLDTISSEILETQQETIRPRPFSKKSFLKNHRITLRNLDFSSSQDHISLLPFVKSRDHEPSKPQDSSKVSSSSMYINSLVNNNWHNVKPYNKLHIPRTINANIEKTDSEISLNQNQVKNKNINVKTKLFPINFNYTQSNYSPGENAHFNLVVKEGPLIYNNKDKTESESFELKRNNQKFVTSNKKPECSKKGTTNRRQQTSRTKNNFDKHVKIGNALNERQVIGDDVTQKMKSFVGGNDLIPDINKYRSDLDKENDQVPASLDIKVCDYSDIHGTMLYVKTDGSIDTDYVKSIANNLGIEFIAQSYMECSWMESFLASNPLVLINWSNTRIRMFGGAIHRQALDLCK